MRELRDYQKEGLEALRQTVRQGVKRVVLQLPTRAGKTRVAAEIASSALSKGNKLAFCCPRISLVDQTIEEFYQEEVRDVGVIQSNHILSDWSKPIQICSIDTVRRRGFPEAKIIIIDEVHEWRSIYQQWMADRPDAIFIGLSATPYTKGLGKYFETMITLATTKELIDKKWLSPFRHFASGHPDLSGVKITAGDYQEDQLSSAMQKGTLTADIVETWKSKWGKDKTLCFAVDCLHAKAIQERFIAAGVPCGYQDARTPLDERSQLKRDFHNSSLPVIVSVGTLTMGVTFDVRCISFCRPTRSEMVYQQILGRGLGTAPDKLEVIILDHTDSWNTLGLVTDIHHDHLNGGKETVRVERKPALPKECKACGMLKPPRTLLCPNCGHQAVAVNGIHEDEGELQEITRGVALQKKKKQEYTQAEKQVWFSMLLCYARDKGYKQNFAAQRYRSKFGVWPRGLKDTLMAPNYTVISWIKHEQIRWAKSKRAAEAHA